ncbi:MAG: YlxR family protein [Acidimicrobiia bacterium]
MSSRPQRTCIGCRRTAPAAELVRIVRRPDGALAVGRHEPGRGAWLCAGTTPDCFEAAVRRRAFGRALRTEVSGDQLACVRGKLVV